MKVVLTALMIIAAFAGISGKRTDFATVAPNDPKALINNQTGDAYFRANKNAKEFILQKKKSVARKLFADEEIRCGKDCIIELKFCTGSKRTITEADDWYRIADLACKDDIPGFAPKKGPGAGRQGVYRFDTNDNERIITPIEPRNNLFENREKETSSTIQTSKETIGKETRGEKSIAEKETRKEIAIAEKNAEKGISRIKQEREGFERSTNMTRAERYSDYEMNRTRYYRSFSIPDYSKKWYFQYPYPEATVVPKFFIFDVAERMRPTANGKIHLFITLSAFEDANSLRISKEWKKEMFFQNGILTDAKGQPIIQTDAQGFLEETRKYAGQLPARIYCTITVGEVSQTDNTNVNLRTFGFQFYVITSNDEKAILEEFEIANKETGIAYYFGRAAVFEKLGLIKSATAEYIEALKTFPENEIIESRLRAINDISQY